MTAAPSQDELMADMLDQLARATPTVQPSLLEQFAIKHPSVARELRSLWATMQMAESFGPALLEEASASISVELLASAGSRRDPSQRSALPSRLISGINGRVIGDYELQEEIGRGGMGVVYRARQISLDRTVALKMIQRSDLASPVDISRFRAEAESAARLDHPQIVPVYEVGEHQGSPYFSMKLIDGTTLSKLIADGPLPSRQAAELLLPVCRAVADAHRRGVIHRDLKPSNILIDLEGRPYVTDFGLAKRTAAEPNSGALDHIDMPTLVSLTQTGAILGTPAYMAPEQAAAQRGEVGPATDIYSLGAILYAMLTGRPPFQAPSPLDTIFMVLEQDPLPPRILNPKADDDLELITLKCLQKPSDLRYTTADELADDLQRYLGSEPISARSSHFTKILTQAFRETHHAAVLENWGLLWMWHSLQVLLLCLVTNYMHWNGVVTRWPYFLLWSVGVGIWAVIFWGLRRRSGPITFVERQIAHVWSGSALASSMLFGLEALLALPPLTLSCVLPLIAGNVFLVKAGVLSGKFYLQSAALYATSFVMALIKSPTGHDFGLTLFGVVISACFFLPGLKYYRQRVAVSR